MGHQKKKVRSRKQALYFVAALSLLIAGIYLFFEWRADTKLIKIHFEKAGAENSGEFKLEPAITPESREKGLMFRRSMDQDKGMIFIFPESKVNTFWMKNTYIPLDMIFISENLEVVGVLSNVPVLNETARSVGVPSKIIIELNAGLATKYGIDKGWKVVPARELPHAK